MTAIIRSSERKRPLVEALLHEISILMERLAETGETGAIDLKSLPLTDLERHELVEKLGEGEVRAAISAAGTSTIFETQFAGVWCVRHEDLAGGVTVEQIAVARVPEMLLAHPADIAAARSRLNTMLAHSTEEEPALKERDSANT